MSVKISYYNNMLLTSDGGIEFSYANLPVCYNMESHCDTFVSVWIMGPVYVPVNDK